MQIIYLLSHGSSLLFIHVFQLFRSLFSFRGSRAFCHFTSHPDENLTGPSSNIPACFTTFSRLIVHHPAAFKIKCLSFSPCQSLSSACTRMWTHTHTHTQPLLSLCFFWLTILLQIVNLGFLFLLDTEKKMCKNKMVFHIWEIEDNSW